MNQAAGLGHETAPTAFVVADDPAVRQSLQRLLESAGMRVETYPSAQTYLETFAPHAPGCLLLDAALPRTNGLDIQSRLRERGAVIPIIFLAGEADVPTVVRTIKSGAFDFVERPFDDSDLLNRIRLAFARDATLRKQAAFRRDATDRLARLTPREREVLRHVVLGGTCESIADDLGITRKTIEAHRSNVLRKTGAVNVAELVRLATAVSAD